MKLNKISAVLTGDSKEKMEPPNVVEKILYLSSKGWGKRRIAKELGTALIPLNIIGDKGNGSHTTSLRELRS